MNNRLIEFENNEYRDKTFSNQFSGLIRFELLTSFNFINESHNQTYNLTMFVY